MVDFAKRPWAYKVDWRVHCIEKPFDSAHLQPPVRLVIFDFDGALTLYTFMPEDNVLPSSNRGTDACVVFLLEFLGLCTFFSESKDRTLR